MSLNQAACTPGAPLEQVRRIIDSGLPRGAVKKRKELHAGLVCPNFPAGSMNLDIQKYLFSHNLEHLDDSEPRGNSAAAEVSHDAGALQITLKPEPAETATKIGLRFHLQALGPERRGNDSPPAPSGSPAAVGRSESVQSAVHYPRAPGPAARLRCPPARESSCITRVNRVQLLEDSIRIVYTARLRKESCL